jgi:hypothetical protein
MGEIRNAYKDPAEKPLGKQPFAKISRWEDTTTTKMHKRQKQNSAYA